ncbi:Metallo-dependent phosphatase-like protein [Phaeosphaeria sp. MPI-PUGE-AT-0046c]|nr:Metallo-dependent phosphatase-like protein [Phaeosphaeria sp. MPI-PUGE-AT-0046c]
MATTRKTRIVLISDTHNQTPKLPPGDILIHAGDLTNQGSYSELERTVEWLEKSDFEAKVVVAGNHDTTLSPPFFHSSANKWKWPSPQDPAACRQLLLSSPSITYLEHEAATIYLPRRKTTLRVFGSPYTPGQRGWAFQYWGDEEAEKIWGRAEGMDGVNVVVTHGPAFGYVDETEGDGGRAGCRVLARRVKETRPLIHVCGHIHAGRGVERVRWRDTEEDDGVEKWVDPGLGNKKLSLLDLTGKTGRKIENEGNIGERHIVDGKLKDLFEGQPAAQPQSGEGRKQASSLVGCALNEAEVGMHVWRRKSGGAIECRRHGEVGRSEVDVDGHGDGKGVEGRNETAMINAAFLGPRAGNNKAYTFNKPIVVDVELPVWEFDGGS